MSNPVIKAKIWGKYRWCEVAYYGIDFVRVRILMHNQPAGCPAIHVVKRDQIRKADQAILWPSR